ncbi:Maf family protein [Tomitella gaofuii]|uniref:Maf family protein n=1 Tax=Tomitella gaofuii TaxID=2760083 RepID=UPI0015F9D294|nr:nucleoside triphosphate pyrophosphatase [Tomitella gaofuii]
MATPVAARPGDPGPGGAVAPVRFVLASASPARLSVLRAAGVEPSVRVSSVDEDAVAAELSPGTGPHEVVTALARAKAVDVAHGLLAQPRGADAPADAVVVGCDSMLHIGGRLQGKPHTVATARERWATMAGRSGDLLTGHAVLRIAGGSIVAEAEGVCSTTVRFGTPSPAELEAYLASREPLEVAGAFTLDGLGGWFVDGIEGDPSSVIGIGLPLVRTLLRDVGLDVARVWAGNAD